MKLLDGLVLCSLSSGSPFWSQNAVGPFFGGSVNWAEDHYYVVLEPLRTAGLAIGASVPEGDLIVVSAGGLDPRSPHLLYRARRYGWSIPDRALNAKIIQQLEGVGAQWLAIVSARAPSGNLGAFLAIAPSSPTSQEAKQAFSSTTWPEDNRHCLTTGSRKERLTGGL